MKVCERCAIEIGTKDGDGLCESCELVLDGKATSRKRTARDRANQLRRAREQAMHDCGLVKVRGALGGIYWE